MISISFRWVSMLLSRLEAFWVANLTFVTWMRRQSARRVPQHSEGDFWKGHVWAFWAIWPFEHTCKPARSSFFLRGGQPGWFDFRMGVSVSSSLPRKDAKILLQPSNLAENLHICSEDHGIAALSGEVRPSTLEQLKNALSAWRTDPTWCNML